MNRSFTFTPMMRIVPNRFPQMVNLYDELGAVFCRSIRLTTDARI